MRYCKSTIFQANHNKQIGRRRRIRVVCDTAKVRFFKQITTASADYEFDCWLFAILQKYDFSSKSQPNLPKLKDGPRCLRYCKSTIFQANHNSVKCGKSKLSVVCDTAKVRFFKQITTVLPQYSQSDCCLRYCKSTIFQANHNSDHYIITIIKVVCDTAKVRFFKQITTEVYAA